MARALDIGEVSALLEAIVAGLDPATIEIGRAGEDTSAAITRPIRKPVGRMRCCVLVVSRITSIRPKAIAASAASAAAAPGGPGTVAT